MYIAQHFDTHYPSTFKNKIGNFTLFFFLDLFPSLTQNFTLIYFLHLKVSMIITFLASKIGIQRETENFNFLRPEN